MAYLALKYYSANEARACENISIRTLAKRVNVSEDTMKRGLTELEEKQVIAIHKRSRKSNDGKQIPLPNLYEIANIETIGGEPI